MSDLRTQIIKSLDNTIESFTRDISKKYGMPISELLELWRKCTIITDSATDIKPEEPSQTKSTEEIKPDEVKEDEKTSEGDNMKEKYEKMKKTELSKLCKEKGLKTTGKKDELIERLINPPKIVQKKSLNTEVKKTILQSISTTIPTIHIRRNAFGNYEHSETKLVFDKVNKLVHGRQLDNGTIEPVNSEIIELCEKYKFKCVLPENLNTNNSSLEDIKLNEDEDPEDDDILDDDDIEDEIEEDDDDEDLGEFYEDDD